MGRTAKANGKVLFTSQEQDYIRLANLGGGSIQATLKKSEDVGVIVGYQAARLLFRQHRQASRFDESLQRVAGECITGGASGNSQRFLCLAQERDRLTDTFRVREHRLRPKVFIRLVEHLLIFFDASFLQIDGDGQVNRPASAAEG